MKRILTATVGLALALGVAGCATAGGESEPPGQVSPQSFLTSQGLGGMEAVEIVDYLDRVPVPARSTGLMASVRHDELVLAADGQEIALDLPEDRTYVSVAPYVDQTHDCFHHSLTTCRGEMGGETLGVTFIDGDTGEKLIEEEVTAFDNGFVGFWVPSHTTGTIEVSHQGRTGTTEFSTEEDGATCVTDLQLN